MTVDLTGAVPPVPDGGGISAGIALTLGRIATATERTCQQIASLSAARQAAPNFVPITFSGLVPAGNAPLCIQLGGPQAGRQWTLRRWCVSDATSITGTIAGTPTANLFVGTPIFDGVTARGVANQWVDTMTPPTVRTWSAGQCVVNNNDEVFVIVTFTGSSTAGQMLLASVYIEEAPVAASTTVTEV